MYFSSERTFKRRFMILKKIMLNQVGRKIILSSNIRTQKRFVTITRLEIEMNKIKRKAIRVFSMLRTWLRIYILSFVLVENFNVDNLFN